MKSVIYIAHNKLQLIAYETVGTPTVSKVISKNLTEGAVLNGIIMDSKAVTDVLSEMYSENKGLFQHLRLILDSGELIFKKMPVPELKKKQYEKLVEEEMNDRSALVSDLIFGYSLMTESDSKNRGILACGVSEALVSTYVEIFAQLGIQIESIETAFEAIMMFMEGITKDGAYILNIVDDTSMLTMIFNLGKFVFSKRARVLADNSDQLVDFITSELSQTTQFIRTQDIEGVTKSYYMGVTKEVIDQLVFFSPIYKDMVIDFDPLAKTGIPEAVSAEILPKLSFCISTEGLQIDLLKGLNKKRNPEKEREPIRGTKLILPMLILAFILGFAGLKIYSMRLKSKATELQAYIESPEVIQKLEIIDAWTMELDQKNLDIGETNMYKTLKESYPTFDSKKLTAIYKCAGDTIVHTIGFTAEEQKVILLCSGATEQSGKDFAAALRKEKGITDVVYTGYSKDANGRFTFNLEVIYEGGLTLEKAQ